MKDVKVTEGRHSIQKPFLWLHITTMVLIVCWLAFLTLSPQQQSAMSADMIRQLKRSQDVTSSKIDTDADLFFHVGTGGKATDEWWQ